MIIEPCRYYLSLIYQLEHQVKKQADFINGLDEKLAFDMTDYLV